MTRIEGELPSIQEKLAEVAIIKDAEGEARASEFFLQIKRRHDLVKEKKLSYTRPFKQQIEVIEADFNQILKPLDEMATTLKSSLTAWRNSQIFKEAEAKGLEIERQTKEAVGEGDAVKTGELVSEGTQANAEAPKIVRASSGSISYRNVAKFEIVDTDKLPAKYLIPDEKKIRATVNAGTKSIAGVRIWTEKVPVGRR